MITAELMEDETKRDTKGRRITAKARRAELIAAYEQSGLTQAKFARQEGIKYQTFTSWVSDARARDRAMEGTAIERRAGTPLKFAEVGLPAMALGGSLMETAALSVTLPDGLVVLGADTAAVAALDKALRG